MGFLASGLGISGLELLSYMMSLYWGLQICKYLIVLSRHELLKLSLEHFHVSGDLNLLKRSVLFLCKHLCDLPDQL